MDEFFEDPNFIKNINHVNLSGKKEILITIMKAMKQANPELSIDTFICILHKLIDPSISYMKYSASRYMYSVIQWNEYNSQKKNESLLITSPDLVY
jgi:hypothetical protein